MGAAGRICLVPLPLAITFADRNPAAGTGQSGPVFVNSPQTGDVGALARPLRMFRGGAGMASVWPSVVRTAAAQMSFYGSALSCGVVMAYRRRAAVADNSRMRQATCRKRLLPPRFPCKVQVALTRRRVCGLSMEEIAWAFLVCVQTLALRTVPSMPWMRVDGLRCEIPFRQSP